MLDRMVLSWRAGDNRFDKLGETYLGVFCAGSLLAVGGINRDPFAQTSSVGRIRHLFVHSGQRRSGHGTLLLTHLIEAARPHFEVLRLRTTSPIANLYYEANGFRRVDEAHATHSLVLTPED